MCSQVETQDGIGCPLSLAAYYFWKQGLSLNLELKFSWVDQKPVSLRNVVCPPQGRVYSCVWATQLVKWVLGSKLFLIMHQQPLTTEQRSSPSCLLLKFLSYFSLMIKYPDQSSLREERYFWLTVQGIAHVREV